MRAKFGRALIGGMCAVLVVGGLVEFAAPAFAAECESGNPLSPPDVDGDMAADVVVGVPSAANGAGAVDVRGGLTAPVALTTAMLGAGSGEGAAFGSAIAISDLDQDGCSDLVIGAPGEGQSDLSDGAGDHEGQVHIAFGGRTGIDLSTTLTLPHDSSNLDRFGSALVLNKRYDGTTWVHDLWVGAPQATVSGQALAGEVFHYIISADPDSRVEASLREVRTQDSPGIPGASEAGDRFGSVLASTDTAGVLVGIPNEDVGAATNAGAVCFLRVDSTTGAPLASQSWSQASAKVAGVPETGDQFGAAIGSRWEMAAIGVPGEDQGSKANSGMIQTLTLNAGGAFVPGSKFTQDTAGVPGQLEAGDRFGAAVAVGISLTGYTGATDVAVGAPGEDLDTVANAGAVNLINLKVEHKYNSEGPQPQFLQQGTNLVGITEAGDEVGSSLGLTLSYSEAKTDFKDRLLIGVPREDVGTDIDSGIVQSAFRTGWRSKFTSGSATYTALKFSTDIVPRTYYGQVLAIPSD
ncbi:MAG TPA: integrin alpha [Kineosporiaceae bacterium]|nr:integrin alpha [Kineosporiaceae bacterium]